MGAGGACLQRSGCSDLPFLQYCASETSSWAADRLSAAADEETRGVLSIRRWPPGLLPPAAAGPQSAAPRALSALQGEDRLQVGRVAPAPAHSRWSQRRTPSSGSGGWRPGRGFLAGAAATGTAAPGELFAAGCHALAWEVSRDVHIERERCMHVIPAACIVVSQLLPAASSAVWSGLSTIVNVCCSGNGQAGAVAGRCLIQPTCRDRAGANYIFWRIALV